MEPSLTQYHTAILSFLARQKYGKKSSSQIYEEFLTPHLRKGHIKTILKDLENCGYIKSIELDEQMVSFLGEMSGSPVSIDGFKITELGRTRATTSGVSTQVNNFSNISNSVISNNSSNVTQTVSYSDQSEDMREAIDALNNAIASKDSSVIKKTFGYIADKSVDVAIAVVTGALIR